MSDSLPQLEHIGGFSLALFVYLFLYLLPSAGVVYLLYFLLTLPMRRAERARVFLDLLELGLGTGRMPEITVVDASATRDKSLPVRFHLLAAWIAKGLRLSQALDRVPRFIPARIVAMLKAGERLGDIRKVIPACRLLLKDAVSSVRGATNYLVVIALAVTPFTVIIPVMLRVKVMPVLESLYQGAPLPAFTRLVLGLHSWFIAIQIGVLAIVWVAALVYLAGPRLRRWADWLVPGLADALGWSLPWNRKRLLRDFSAMLAVLLDAQVPEKEALELAAKATGSRILKKRAAAIRQRLEQGEKLPEALRLVDARGELRWRFRNAAQRKGGFLRALSGWHESLDAKAFQLEQAAAQTATAALVVINGFIIACIAIGTFLGIINLLYQATLW